jgi:hypothetical protein
VPRLVPAAGEDPLDLADIGGIVGIGSLLQVACEGDDRLVEPPDPAEQQPAIAAVIRVRRLHDGEQLRDAECGRPVALGEMSGTKVAKDAGEDLALAVWPEHARVEQDPVSDRSAEERLTVVGRETPAIARWVEQDAARRAHDEMAGQADADEAQSDPPCHLQLDDRQGDRKADAPGDDDIEQACSWVVVFRGGWAAEARFAEEDVLEAIDDVGLRVADIEADSDPLREVVEGGQGHACVELRPAVGRYRESASGEVDIGLRLGNQPGEARSIGRAGRFVMEHDSDGNAGWEATQRGAAESACVVGNSVPRAMLPNPYRFGRICARRTADVTAVGAAPGLLELRPAPAGLPDPNLVPPTIAESGDPFAAVRIVALLARIERARPVRIADIVDRLNAIYVGWIFPAAVVADVAVQLQANWMTDYRNSSGIVVEDGEYGPTIAIEDSSRVDPWIVRQALREAAACRERLDAFSRLDRAAGEG